MAKPNVPGVPSQMNEKATPTGLSLRGLQGAADDDFIVLRRPALRRSHDEDKNLVDPTEELPDSEVKRQVSLFALRPLYALATRGSLGRRSKGFEYRVELVDAKFATTNTAAGKYGVILNPGVNANYSVNSVSSVAEWSALSTLFDEFFVRSVKMEWVPINKYSAVSGSGGTLANLNTSGLAVVGIQHSGPAISDAAASWTQALTQRDSALHNSGDMFTFHWKNVEKFDWSAPVGDQTTSQSTQTWCSVSNVAKYGGFLQAFLPSVTAAASSVTAFAEGINIAIVTYRFDVCLRVRA